VAQIEAQVQALSAGEPMSGLDRQP
jgi:hypothetical protein